MFVTGLYELRCRLCDQMLCVRGMKAILLADRSVELYSTDLPPPGLVSVCLCVCYYFATVVE